MQHCHHNLGISPIIRSSSMRTQPGIFIPGMFVMLEAWYNEYSEWEESNGSTRAPATLQHKVIISQSLMSAWLAAHRTHLQRGDSSHSHSKDWLSFRHWEVCGLFVHPFSLPRTVTFIFTVTLAKINALRTQLLETLVRDTRIQLKVPHTHPPFAVSVTPIRDWKWQHLQGQTRKNKGRKASFSEETLGLAQLVRAWS